MSVSNANSNSTTNTSMSVTGSAGTDPCASDTVSNSTVGNSQGPSVSSMSVSGPAFSVDNSQSLDHNYSVPPDSELDNSHSNLSSMPTELSPDFFKPNEEELHEVSTFTNKVFHYIIEKFAGSKSGKDVILPNLKGKFYIESPVKSVETSKLIYLDVLNVSADKISTIKSVLDRLRAGFVRDGKVRNLLMVGDQKIFKHLKDLKSTYPDLYSWVYPFIGDFHVLFNYQKVLMGLYFKAGLEQLSKILHHGKSSSIIEQTTNFKHVHMFLIQIWESIYRMQIEKFFTWRETKSSQSCTMSNDEVLLKIDETIQLLSKSERKNGFDNDVLDSFIKSQATLFQCLDGLENDFKRFRQESCTSSATFAFWDKFLHVHCLYYISLWISVRTSNWNLRLASIKGIAPVFHVCDKPHYSQLLPEHLADCNKMPEDILYFLKQGGFTSNINGHVANSLALDEIHECSINRDVKQAISRLEHKKISNLNHYLTWRAKFLANIKFQLSVNVNENYIKDLSKSYLSKFENVIGQYLDALRLSAIFELNQKPSKILCHVFTKENVCDEIQDDMSKIDEKATESYEKYVTGKYIRQSSVPVKLVKTRLRCFGSQFKKTKSTQKLLCDQQKHNKYLQSIISFCFKTGTPISQVGQLLELPLAICKEDGSPYKAPKYSMKTFYKKRYKGCAIFSLCLPDYMKPNVLIFDAMNILHILEPVKRYIVYNSNLIEIPATFASYAMDFLRYINKWKTSDTREIHIVFDNNNDENPSPKDVEQRNRDSSGLIGPACTISAINKTPVEWKSFLRNRENKYNLIDFLCRYFLDNSNKCIKGEEHYVIAGGFKNDLKHKAFQVSKDTKCEIGSLFSNHVEADNRIWLHTCWTTYENILIISKDTDLYHIGLPIVQSHQNKNVFIQLQLSATYDNDDKYIHVNGLLNALQNDHEFHSVPKHVIPYFIMLFFICSGCDFTSSFYGFGKSTFMDLCFKNSEFIYKNKINEQVCNLFDPTTVNSFRSCDLCTQNTFCNSCIVRLESYICGLSRAVGSVYFTKVKNALNEHFSHKFMKSQYNIKHSTMKNHESFLAAIRTANYNSATYENTCLPSFDALKYHFFRVLYIYLLWLSAGKSGIHNHDSLERYGYNTDGSYVWDTPENLEEIQKKVKRITKGCKCKKGRCLKNCGCKRSGNFCGPGCDCDDCHNLETKVNVPESRIIEETESDSEYYSEYYSEYPTDVASEVEIDYQTMELIENCV